MELLVSGFAIILLIQAQHAIKGYVSLLIANAGSSDLSQGLSIAFGFIILAAAVFGITSLAFVVLLRALWIAAIGVRSFSGEIDYQELKLSGRFERFLQKRVGPFDTYILKLERLCSSVFALTFLVIFSFAALVLFLTFIGLCGAAAFALFGQNPGTPVAVLLIVLLVLYVLSALLYAIDFFTGSRLKRSENFAKFYFPIYRFFGWISLARLYRPIYYNLIDNGFGRRIVWLLIPYCFLMVTFGVFDNSLSSPLKPTVDSFGVIDNRTSKHFMESTSIPSFPILSDHIAREAFLELYIPLSHKIYTYAEENCVESSEAYFGINTRGNSSPFEGHEVDKYISCLTDDMNLKLDGAIIPLPDFVFSLFEQTEVVVLLGLVPTDSLVRGKHLLELELVLEENPVTLAHLPFLKP